MLVARRLGVRLLSRYGGTGFSSWPSCFGRLGRLWTNSAFLRRLVGLGRTLRLVGVVLRAFGGGNERGVKLTGLVRDC
jgi:hypothetical protein